MSFLQLLSSCFATSKCDMLLGMERHHKELLQNMRMELKEQIGSSVLDVVQYILSKGIINHDMNDFILAGRTSSEKVYQLLDILPTRGHQAFQVFYEAMCYCHLWGAADILKPDKAPHEKLSRIVDAWDCPFPIQYPVIAGQNQAISYGRKMVPVSAGGVLASPYEQGIAKMPIRFKDVLHEPHIHRLPQTIKGVDVQVEKRQENTSRKIVDIFEQEWQTNQGTIKPKSAISSYQCDKGTQTVNPTQTSTRLLQDNTVFETPWQVSDTFTDHGGILQSQNSDVSLHIVPGAVKSDDDIKIHGAVCTDIDKILEKFDVPREESLITPLVEYHASRDYQFSDHLKINLPHFLPKDIDVKFVKVYVFSVEKYRKISLQTIDASHGSKQACYWTFGKRNIQIYTTHFSGYFCTVCKSKLKEERVQILFARLFGSQVHVRSNLREMRLILYIWDERLNIRDFLQEKCRIVSGNSFLPLDDSSLELPENTSSDSQIITEICFKSDKNSRNGWSHVLKPHRQKPVFHPIQVRKLYRVIECCRSADPLRFEWVLENSSGSEQESMFYLCIDVICISNPTTNYEKALREADENSMLTFYLQDSTLNETFNASTENYQRNNTASEARFHECYPSGLYVENPSDEES